MENNEIIHKILSVCRTTSQASAVLDSLVRELIESTGNQSNSQVLEKFNNRELIEEIALRLNNDNFCDSDCRSLIMELNDELLMEELIRSTASQLAEGFTASEEEKCKIISLVNILNIYLGKTSC